MIDANDIRAEFKRAISDEIEFAQDGLGRFIVHVPFTFEDGDHFVILLKQMDNRWLLSDEGHTFMHLSYSIHDVDKGTRRKVIDRVLAQFGVEDRQGELVLPIPVGRYADALFSYVQAITRVSDVSFLSREQVRTTFLEDFRQMVQDAAPATRRVEFQYTHPEFDPDRRYPVDARVNGTTARQTLMFAIANDEQCRDATIIARQWEYWKQRFRLVAVFRDQTEINRIVLARFSDVAERQFSSLETARERLPQYLQEEFSSTN